MEPAPAGGTVGGNKLPFWAIKSAEKWEFVGPPYYAPQVRSSLQRKLFFTICRRQILHHAQRAFFTTASAVLLPNTARVASLTFDLITAI